MNHFAFLFVHCILLRQAKVLNYRNNYWENEEEMLNQRQISQRLKRNKLQVQPVIPDPTPAQSFTVAPTVYPRVHAPAPAPAVVVLPRVHVPIIASSDHLSAVAEYDDRFLFSPPDQSTLYRTEEIPSISTVRFSMETTSATKNIVIFDQTGEVPFERYPTRIRSPPAKFPASPTSTNPYDNKNFEAINDMLHSTYGYSNGYGTFTKKKFNAQYAEIDIKCLKEIKVGSLEDDQENFLLKMWINKIKNALSKIADDEKENESEKSDSGSD